jgi:hypothetical protein
VLPRPLTVLVIDLPSFIIRFRVSSNRLCICLVQKQRFDKVWDNLEAVINKMQRTRELLKKIADMAGDDEVCFRLHEISLSLEEIVGRK